MNPVRWDCQAKGGAAGLGWGGEKGQQSLLKKEAGNAPGDKVICYSSEDWKAAWVVGECGTS